MRTRMSLSIAVALAASLSPVALAQGGFSGPGRYEITNVKSGRSFGADSNTVMQMSGGNASYWDIQPAGGGYYYIRNANTGLALEASYDRNSAPVTVTRYTGSSNQQWRLEPGKDGNPMIVSRFGKALDVPDGSDRDGVRIQIYDRNGDSNQRFMLRQVRGGGGFGGFGGGWRDRNRNQDYSSSTGTFTCSSDDGGRHHCNADVRGRSVRMSRQISGSPCREGSTWGYDNNGVWVDRGCRAEFEITNQGYGNRGYDRRNDAPTLIRCSSDDGRRNYCRADTRHGVRMTRQISGSACREGYSWGYDRDNIWVDHGCRAEFEVGGGR